ncbi:toxin biosynthesis [Botrytis cinerea]
MEPRFFWAIFMAFTSSVFHGSTANAHAPPHQAILGCNEPTTGHNELYIPDYNNPVPGKLAFTWQHSTLVLPRNQHTRKQRFIARSGRNISYEEIAQASRDVFNFGDDNIIIVLSAAFAYHPGLDRLDLDMLADEAVHHRINCPASPTRNDRELGDNVNMNMTLLESLLGFSKDGETLTLEDLAEHHHLRHNQSLAENSHFRFGNLDAACALAQYANLVGMLGKIGKNGLLTLFVEDVRQFYVDEDLPIGYGRRQLPYYSIESNQYIDRMAHHIGFQIVRPWPVDDQDGRDVEPVFAKFN